MITIRKFTHEDIAAVQQSLYPDLTASQLLEMIDKWNSGSCRGRRFEMFAILSDERIVGCVSLYEHSEHIASAGAEMIAEERRKGVASQALSLLMQHASDIGYRIILDQVAADNTASIQLHKKLGFESDGYIYRNRRGREVVLFLKLI